MRIAWIIPCSKMYDSIDIYFRDIEKFSWPIHVFHNIEQKRLKHTTIFQPHIRGLEKSRKHYVILHYFLDDCEECKKIKYKSIFGQRIFISRNVDGLDFETIIFKYLEVI